MFYEIYFNVFFFPRLKSRKGLTALLREFDDFHFRGKGHELEDLRRVLVRMEIWAHRLHPKMHFEDFIAKAEKICTKKKEMQVKLVFQNTLYITLLGQPGLNVQQILIGFWTLLSVMQQFACPPPFYGILKRPCGFLAVKDKTLLRKVEFPTRCVPPFVVKPLHSVAGH